MMVMMMTILKQTAAWDDVGLAGHGSAVPPPAAVHPVPLLLHVPRGGRQKGTHLRIWAGETHSFIFIAAVYLSSGPRTLLKARRKVFLTALQRSGMTSETGGNAWR